MRSDKSIKGDMGRGAISMLRGVLSSSIGVGLLFWIAGCQKIVDMEYHDIDPLPVIEATLSQDGAKVVITETTPMGEAMDLTRYTDAEVTIEDLTEGSLRTLYPDASGAYVDAEPGISGHSYSLRVFRSGKSYESTVEMRNPTDILGLQFRWVTMPYDQVAALQVFFTDKDPLPGNYYWVRVYKNGETYKWTLTSDAGAVNGVIVEAMRVSRKNPDDENGKSVLKKGDIVTVKVTSISQQLFDYLTAIGNDSNGQPQYQGDFCLGYFMAAPTAESSLPYDPDIIE